MTKRGISGEKMEMSKAMLQEYIISMFATQCRHADIEVQQLAAGAQGRQWGCIPANSRIGT
jgi:hypothetical protein